jgi:hypothetical protein
MTPNDEKHLRLLVQLHYIVGGLAATIPLFGLAYTALGVALLLGKLSSVIPTAHAGGWFPLGMGLFFTLVGGAAAAANILTARSIETREHRALCLLTATLNCLHIPLGTLLGGFTISVLSRPAVRAAFTRPIAPPMPLDGPPPSLPLF